MGLRLDAKPVVSKRTGAVVWPDDEEYTEAVSEAAHDENDDGPVTRRKPDFKPTFEKPKLKLGQKKTKPMAFAVVSNSVKFVESLSTDASFSLCSLNAARIAIALLLRVNAKQDKHFWTFRTTCYELSRTLGLDYDLGHEQIKKLLSEVAKIVFTVYKHREYVWAPLTETAKLGVDEVIRLKLNKGLRPYLLDLQEKYRKLYPSMLQLRSPRAVLLYIFLRRFVGLHYPEHGVSMADLQRVMQLKDVPWNEFRRTYLDPAIKDINQRTELAVSYRVKRAGEQPNKPRGEIEALIFRVRERSKPTSKLLEAGKHEQQD